jgi:hypothetical protein
MRSRSAWNGSSTVSRAAARTSARASAARRTNYGAAPRAPPVRRSR